MSIESISVGLKRIQFVRLALALLLLNGIILTLLVLPKRAKISTLQANYATLRSDAVVDQREIRTLQTRLKNIQQAQKNMQTIYTQVLETKKKGVTDIRLELESLTRSLDIKRQDFSYSYETLKDFNLQHFMLGVPVEGNYRNIRRFINSIERSKHFLILDRVDLSSEEKVDVLNLDFRISTYLVEDES
jgi:hypothetical protein